MIDRNEKNNFKFLKSALVKESFLHTTDFILKWLRERKAEAKYNIHQIPLSDLKEWAINDTTGNIHHQSGRFFSIEGVMVKTNYGLKASWEQPIIYQPEIGFLGILTKQIGGVLHFLLQAKIEPGNINTVQLSPTLQATKSNYSRVHKGKMPLYIEYFNGDRNADVLIDQLQSEQGARFFKKRNRNIIVEIPQNEDIPVYDNFIWVTLGQLKMLMSFDNVVNMDTRTVISSVSFGSFNNLKLVSADLSRELEKNVNHQLLYSMLHTDEAYFSIGQIISWITNLKCKYELNVSKINLKNIAGWSFDGDVIFNNEHKYFSVIGVNIQIENREVVSWDQPMIKPAQEGILGFIIKKINGVYHVLVQAKVEAGNFDILELAPTVQCLTGNFRSGYNEYTVPFMNEIMGAKKENIWHKSYQSEEGGRFYKEQNLNIIVEADSDFNDNLPENYCWMTLNQLSTFVKFNNYLNIGSRSLISLIPI